VSCESCEVTIRELIDANTKLRELERELEIARPVVLAAVHFVRVKTEGQRAFVNDAKASKDIRAVQGKSVVEVALMFEAHAKRLSCEIGGALEELEAAVTVAALHHSARGRR